MGKSATICNPAVCPLGLHFLQPVVITLYSPLQPGKTAGVSLRQWTAFGVWHTLSRSLGMSEMDGVAQMRLPRVNDGGGDSWQKQLGLFSLFPSFLLLIVRYTSTGGCQTCPQKGCMAGFARASSSRSHFPSAHI